MAGKLTVAHQAALVKPNLAELVGMTGGNVRTPSGLADAGTWLSEVLDGTAVLVTRGAEGMALFRAGEAPLALAAGPSRRVFDVTGAGDTAAAVLALALGAGLAVEVAARLANAAAGLAVCKVGTATVGPDELLAALAEDAPDFAPLNA